MDNAERLREFLLGSGVKTGPVSDTPSERSPAPLRIFESLSVNPAGKLTRRNCCQRRLVGSIPSGSCDELSFESPTPLDPLALLPRWIFTISGPDEAQEKNGAISRTATA